MVVSEIRENCREDDVGSGRRDADEQPIRNLSPEVEEEEVPTRISLEPSGGSAADEGESDAVEAGTEVNEPYLSEDNNYSSDDQDSSVSSQSSTSSITVQTNELQTITTSECLTEQYLNCGNGTIINSIGFQNGFGFDPQFYHQQQPIPFIPNNNMGGIILPAHPSGIQPCPTFNNYMDFNQYQQGGGMIHGPVGIHSPMMMPANPVPIPNHVPFPQGRFIGFPSNAPMQMIPTGMIPQQQQQGSYAVMPAFPQLVPQPVNGFFPQFQQPHQQPIIYATNGNGDCNFGTMVPYHQQQQQLHQSFVGEGILPAPVPWASHAATNGMVVPIHAEIPVPYSWENSSVEASTCPSSPYTSTDSDCSSSGVFPLGSTDDSSSASSTGMSPRPLVSKRQKFKRPERTMEPLLKTTTFIVDLTTTFVMNGEELPYVMNVWDPNRPMKFLKPPPNLEYYVPPAVDDFDFFGGQQHMWQIKMAQYFGQFQPDLWKLQAVPDFYRSPDQGWIGFNITSKLRFCCRSCRTPWTSKQGKILFGFTKDESSGLGWIFMKIFGQICMKKQRKRCHDWTYQQPACYPEEIERAVQKLSEYVGYRFYNVQIPYTIFEECGKSIRLATARSNGCNTAIAAVENHHRKDLCQACLQGVCRQKMRPPPEFC